MLVIVNLGNRRKLATFLNNRNFANDNTINSFEY